MIFSIIIMLVGRIPFFSSFKIYISIIILKSRFLSRLEIMEIEKRSIVHLFANNLPRIHLHCAFSLARTSWDKLCLLYLDEIGIITILMPKIFMVPHRHVRKIPSFTFQTKIGSICDTSIVASPHDLLYPYQVCWKSSLVWRIRDSYQHLNSPKESFSCVRE